VSNYITSHSLEQEEILRFLFYKIVVKLQY